MDYFAATISSIINVFLVGMLIAGVLKLFQIHTVLSEIKDALRPGSVSPRIPEVTAAVSPAVYSESPAQLHQMSSGEDMLRALDAQIHLEERTASRHQDSEDALERARRAMGE